MLKNSWREVHARKVEGCLQAKANPKKTKTLNKLRSGVKLSTISINSPIKSNHSLDQAVLRKLTRKTSPRNKNKKSVLMPLPKLILKPNNVILIPNKNIGYF